LAAAAASCARISPVPRVPDSPRGELEQCPAAGKLYVVRVRADGQRVEMDGFTHFFVPFNYIATGRQWFKFSGAPALAVVAVERCGVSP